MNIKGMQISLVVKTKTGVDPFGAPVYATETITIDNVLVAQPTTEDITSATDMYGKRLAYVMGIPKGDNHNWKDTEVQFFGMKFRTFGDVVQGIEENVPGPWHKKVLVERYE